MVYLPNVNTTAGIYVCGPALWLSFTGKFKLFSLGPVLMHELESGIASTHNLDT
jgi:hypothetical protein